MKFIWKAKCDKVIQSFNLSNFWNKTRATKKKHCVESVQIRSFFWSAFSRFLTEYEDLQSKYPYPARIRENTDQKKLRI